MMTRNYIPTGHLTMTLRSGLTIGQLTRHVHAQLTGESSISDATHPRSYGGIEVIDRQSMNVEVDKQAKADNLYGRFKAP